MQRCDKRRKKNNKGPGVGCRKRFFKKYWLGNAGKRQIGENTADKGTGVGHQWGAETGKKRYLVTRLQEILVKKCREATNNKENKNSKLAKLRRCVSRLHFAIYTLDKYI